MMCFWESFSKLRMAETTHYMVLTYIDLFVES